MQRVLITGLGGSSMAMLQTAMIACAKASVAATKDMSILEIAYYATEDDYILPPHYRDLEYKHKKKRF